MFAAITSRVKHASAVIVAEAFGRTSLGESLQNIQHFSQSCIEGLGNLYLIAEGQES